MRTDNGRERLRAFVHGSLGTSVLDDDDIFETGRVTSLFSMELVMFIEGTLGITLEDADLERENFNTISAMVRLVDRKRSID